MSLAPAPTRSRPTRRAPTPVRRAAAAVATALQAVRRVWSRARSGQRPLVGVLVVGVIASIVMLSGPTERYLDGRARVEGLRTTAAALDAEVAELEGRLDALDDPRRIEQLAREHQGMVRPGEVPYTLVPPEVERPRIAERPAADAGTDDPWYARTWRRVRGWF